MDGNPYFDPPSGSSPVGEQHALELAKLAVNFDRQEKWAAALFYYQETVGVLLQLMEGNSSLPDLENKIQGYISRAEVVAENMKADQPVKAGVQPIAETSDLKRAEFLLREAMDEDEAGNTADAVQRYMDAVELCLKAKSEAKQEETKKHLTILAGKALSRAEELKGVNKSSEVTSNPLNAGQIPALPQGLSHFSLTTKTSTSVTTRASLLPSPMKVVGPSSYSKEELEVLRITSVINGREYVPFLFVDLKERFAFPLPFSDKDGFLKLSAKQKTRFSKWARLDEISSAPKIIQEIDCFNIKQTLVSDCSFMASLTVSALYEKKFKKKVITSIIYPQNRFGEATYNPCGKYMIKLHINGIYRKVIIDDCFPVDSRGSLLCSFSVNSDEFWVSLLEKAYMKVMGGYDFPGSNSNIDLHALTGWVPERIATKEKSAEERNTLFHTLIDRHRKGDVLITIATGEFSEAVGDKTGLVSTHAYAVLDLRFVEGKMLLLVKNPWSHLRWKGSYSERDVTNWTPSLKKALNYDPQNAKSFDDGVFYIDFKSLCHFFEAIYLNWNPALFKYTYSRHDSWRAGSGPVKDVYNIGDNPQYKLSIEGENGSTWILLTRHITDRDDFAENKEFIAIMVYKGGEKVYLPFDPPPFLDGARINSPHYLCKLTTTATDTKNYTLVVSQYERTATIYYTIRVYSTIPFNLNKINISYKYKEKITTGEWTEATAGGCANHQDTYGLNPVYQFEVNGPREEDNQLLIDLKGPKQYSVGFDVKTVNVRDSNSPNYFSKLSSGSYRSGFTILRLNSVPAGTYHLIPSTYQPKQKGPFFLQIQSTCPVTLRRLR